MRISFRFNEGIDVSTQVNTKKTLENAGGTTKS